MKKNIKRIIALCICCALLAAAVIQNVYSNKKKAEQNPDTLVDTPNDEASGDTLAGTDADADTSADTDNSVPTGIKCDSTADYLSGLRLERDQVRSLAAEECMSIIESEDAGADEKTKAQETVQSIGIMQDIENSVETVLKSKGYEDVFVTYSDDGNIDITLVAKTLLQEEATAIANLITETTGVTLACMSLQSVYQEAA